MDLQCLQIQLLLCLALYGLTCIFLLLADESQRQVRMAKVEQNRQKHTCKVCLRKTGMFHAYKRRNSSKAVFKRPCHHSCMVSEAEPCSSRKKESCTAVSQKVSEVCKDNPDESLKENLKECHSDVKRNLSEDEKAKLLDLENAFFEKFASRTIEYSVETLSESHGLFNLATFTVKKLVSFIKSVEEFKSLPIDTKTACLKAHMLCSLVWMAISHYDGGSESIHYQNSLPLHVDLLREAFHDHKEKIEKFIELCKSTTEEITIDIPLKVIILCILVFNPAGEGLTNCRHLSNVQDIYLILLKHYLESKYTYGESKKFFVFLLGKLKDIRSADDSFSEIAQRIPVQKIEPLMREIFQV